MRILGGLCEAQIEGKVNKRVRSYGILCEKVKFVEAGYPDRLYILPNGIHAWIEYKIPGEEPHPLQYYRLEQLSERNCVAGWTDDCDVAVSFLKTLMGAKGLSAAVNSATPGTNGWRAIFRSGARQDFRLSSHLQDLEAAGVRIIDANSSPAPTHVQGVAR